MSRDSIDGLVDRWRQECLVDDGSLLFGDETIWSLENVELFHRAYKEQLNRGDGNFDEKFEAQGGTHHVGATGVAALGAVQR